MLQPEGRNITEKIVVAFLQCLKYYCQLHNSFPIPEISVMVGRPIPLYALDWFQVEIYWIFQTSGSEIFKSKKFFEKLQNGAAQGRWKLADFWQFLIFSTFYKNQVNWPSSGSENWMHNIILKIFGKKYFRKIVKWWCSKPKTIKNLNFSRSAILKIFKNIFF